MSDESCPSCRSPLRRTTGEIDQSDGPRPTACLVCDRCEYRRWERLPDDGLADALADIATADAQGEALKETIREAFVEGARQLGQHHPRWPRC